MWDVSRLERYNKRPYHPQEMRYLLEEQLDKGATESHIKQSKESYIADNVKSIYCETSSQMNGFNPYETQSY